MMGRGKGEAKGWSQGQSGVHARACDAHDLRVHRRDEDARLVHARACTCTGGACSSAGDAHTLACIDETKTRAWWTSRVQGKVREGGRKREKAGEGGRSHLVAAGGRAETKGGLGGELWGGGACVHVHGSAGCTCAHTRTGGACSSMHMLEHAHTLEEVWMPKLPRSSYLRACTPHT